MATKKPRKNVRAQLTESLDTAAPQKGDSTPAPQANVEPWKILVGIIGVIVLIGIAFVFASQTQEVTVEHNGFLFTQTPCPDGTDCWEVVVGTNVGNIPIVLRNSPDMVADILIDQRAVDRVLALTTTKDAFLHLAFDPEAPAEAIRSGVIIATVTGGRFYQIPTQSAVMGVDVTCKSNTPQVAVLYITDGPVPSARLQDNGCVVITAPTGDELERVSESYVLHLLQIMKSS